MEPNINADYQNLASESAPPAASVPAPGPPSKSLPTQTAPPGQVPQPTRSAPAATAQNAGTKEAIQTATNLATIGSCLLELAKTVFPCCNKSENTKSTDDPKPPDQSKDRKSSCWESWCGEDCCCDCDDCCD